MQETVYKDGIIWTGNIYEIRRQIIKYMNKYVLVKDLILAKLN